jgi:hypothetical protein
LESVGGDTEADAEFNFGDRWKLRGEEDRCRHGGRGRGRDPHRDIADSYCDTRYNLASSLNATSIPSLIPLAHDSVLPLLAMPPRLLRQRAKEKIDVLGMMALEFHPDEEARERVRMLGLDEVSRYRHFAK